jgi:hypothetical protein
LTSYRYRDQTLAVFFKAFENVFTVHLICLERPIGLLSIKTFKNGGPLSIMIIKTMPKFGNGDGNWSKMKDLLFAFCQMI